MSTILNAFDGNEIEGIAALIDKLEKSSFDYMKLESDGMSIVIGKSGYGESLDGVTAPAPVSASAKPSSAPESNDGAPASEASEAKAAVPEQEGIYIIKSPSYGLFYAQSEPGAPPYVSIGAAVNIDDTIGLMEIMKTFTAITSPVAGEVVAIHVKNEETLEPGQALVSVKI